MTRRAPTQRRRHTTQAAVTVVGVGLIPLGIAVSVTTAWLIPALVVLAFAAIAAGALAWLADLRTQPSPDADRPEKTEPPAVHDEKTRRLRRTLAQATTDPTAFDTGTRPILVELANERLQAAYGITITTAPDAARARLGEELWQRLTTSSTGRVSAAELRRLVSALERVSPPS